jgi:hypothetical protein
VIGYTDRSQDASYLASAIAIVNKREGASVDFKIGLFLRETYPLAFDQDSLVDVCGNPRGSIGPTMTTLVTTKIAEEITTESGRVLYRYLPGKMET